MGLLTRQTREQCAAWETDPESHGFNEFLEDVAENGLAKACETLHLAQSAVLQWCAANEGRAAAFDAACKVKGEILVHEALGIVDDNGEEVARSKLRAGFRLQVAGYWNDKYRPRVNVQHAGEVRIDAGLTIAMADLLDRVVSTQNQPPAPDAEATALPEPLALPEPAGAVADTLTIVGPDGYVQNVPKPERVPVWI